jgi:hypothetical protein
MTAKPRGLVCAAHSMSRALRIDCGVRGRGDRRDREAAGYDEAWAASTRATAAPGWRSQPPRAGRQTWRALDPRLTRRPPAASSTASWRPSPETSRCALSRAQSRVRSTQPGACSPATRASRRYSLGGWGGGEDGDVGGAVCAEKSLQGNGAMQYSWASRPRFCRGSPPAAPPPSPPGLEGVERHSAVGAGGRHAVARGRIGQRLDSGGALLVCGPRAGVSGWAVACIRARGCEGGPTSPEPMSWPPPSRGWPTPWRAWSSSATTTDSCAAASTRMTPGAVPTARWAPSVENATQWASSPTVTLACFVGVVRIKTGLAERRRPVVCSAGSVGPRNLPPDPHGPSR